jgi:hypothetical protein
MSDTTVSRKKVLKGVMYYRSGHFTVRSDKQTWFHDGVETGVNTEYEGILGDLMNCQGNWPQLYYIHENPL